MKKKGIVLGVVLMIVLFMTLILSVLLLQDNVYNKVEFNQIESLREYISRVRGN